MAKSAKEDQKPIGRPPKPMPEKIPDSAGNIMKALVNAPPKKRKDWKYLKTKGA